MENETNKTERMSKNMYIPICITQAVCVAAILIAVLVIKMFFYDTYKEIKKWHTENFLEETEITATFDEDDR